MKNISKITTLIFLFFLLCNVSFAQTNNTYISSYNKGVQAFKNKNYTTAVVELNKAIKTNPKFYNAYCLLGIVYGMQGKVIQSKQVLEKAIQISPNKWQAYSYLGDIERSQHLYPLAIEYYEKAISISSLEEKGKQYYRNEINKIKLEQDKYNSQANIKKNHPNYFDIALPSNWKMAMEMCNGKQYLVEYGLNGEDVKNYKWTQLITLQFLDKSIINPNLMGSYNQFTSKLENAAKNTNKTFYKKIIEDNSNEILFEFNYGNNEEFGLCRLVQTNKGLYSFGYSKKGNINNEEKQKWIKTLKEVIIY